MFVLNSVTGFLPGFLESCARLYCEVWKEPPWNEDFWQVPEVLNDIQEQLARPNAELILNFFDGRVIGFTWGYEVSQEELRQISTSSDLDAIFQDGKRIAYIDELGVEIGFRKIGVGIELSQMLLEFFRSRSLDRVVLRTDEKAVPARRLYQKLGFREIPVRDGRYPTRTYWQLEL